LEAEVAAYVAGLTDHIDEAGHRLVVRNGYHAEREVVTAAGAVRVRQPRANDRRVDEVTGQRQRFASAILPAWARKSPRVAEVLPLLYLHGLSSGDFAPALEQFLGTGAGLQRDGGQGAADVWDRAVAAGNLHASRHPGHPASRVGSTSAPQSAATLDVGLRLRIVHSMFADRSLSRRGNRPPLS
jgi:hypothetical protein